MCPVDLQFFYLFRGAERLAAAADDVAAAVRDGAMGVGEEHGLPLLRFPPGRDCGGAPRRGERRGR
ncbi:hypothetical protein [Micromonospora profundi]|uniref:hypothetical protein n=1 Tax=Micromonospora TaxID=1873 RepID=UPI0016969D6F|nr:hypothetical protein [Micromonospora profundi]NJC11921.1 hypothetical protein [Micromonospora profundi]